MSYDDHSHYQAPNSFILLNPEDHPVGTQLLFRAMKPGSGLIETRIADWSPGGRVFLEYRELPRSNSYIPVGWYEVRDVQAIEILPKAKTEQGAEEEGE